MIVGPYGPLLKWRGPYPRTVDAWLRGRARWLKVGSEVGRFCLGLRKQVLVEEIAVVLGADGLQHRAVELEPSPCHGERRGERVGVLQRHQRGHAFARR